MMRAVRRALCGIIVTICVEVGIAQEIWSDTL